jgi:hypothetical protein
MANSATDDIEMLALALSGEVPAHARSHESGKDRLTLERIQGSLPQSRTHEKADTDKKPESLHHTLGTDSNQAARGNHTHDFSGIYSAVGHNHDTAYAALNHNHDALYAALNHNHDAAYAALNHNHDALYAALNHNHDAAYAALNHNHDALYAALNHNHDAAYAALNHNHDAAYAIIAHVHDDRYSQLGHTHSGLYEPALGNPDVDGKVLASTTTGVRSWVMASGGSGANAALSNLASVAINASLLPGTSGGVDLGSTAKTWGALYLPVTTSADAGVIKVAGNVYWNTFSGSVADSCLFLGKDIANYTHTGYNLVGIGGLNFQSVTSAYNCFALGRAACASVTDGYSLFGFGISALTSATSAVACLAIGNYCLQTITTSTSNQVTAVGTYTCMNGAVLYDVTAIGAACAVDLGSVSSGRGTYIGAECARYSVKEVESCITGWRARYSGNWTASNSNTIYGARGMYGNVYAYNCTAVGWGALYGSAGQETYASTALGYSAGYAGGSTGVFLGAFAGYYETAANKLFIDNSARDSESDARVKALVYGIFDAAVNNQSIRINGVFFPLQSTTVAQPAYVKGGVYFDTTLSKLMVGGATAWETVTSV